MKLYYVVSVSVRLSYLFSILFYFFLLFFFSCLFFFFSCLFFFPLLKFFHHRMHITELLADPEFRKGCWEMIKLAVEPPADSGGEESGMLSDGGVSFPWSHESDLAFNPSN